MLINPETIKAAQHIKESFANLLWMGVPDNRYFFIANKHGKIIDTRPHKEMPGLDGIITAAARKERQSGD